MSRPRKPVIIEYDARRITKLIESQRLYYNERYIGRNVAPPRVISELDNLIKSGISLTKEEHKLLKREALTLKRLSSPYQRVAEKELARVAIADFREQLDRVPTFTKAQEKNIAAMKKKLDNLTLQQQLDFLKGRYRTEDGKKVLEVGYQDPRTVQAINSAKYPKIPTSKQAARKAYGGKSGYLYQRIMKL